MSTPPQSLAAWAAAVAPVAKVIGQQRMADRDYIQAALDIVEAFIRERRLVIYGGLAIDYALRERGSWLYPDSELPDYDFFSPDSVNDAYALGDRLVAAGFESVGVIRAIHVQTMRVRTRNHFVADVGHAPADVYAALPTIEHRGLRVVHPDFQRLDMHLAFCFPYNGAPREDVFHRWRKDLARLALFDEHWPVGADTGAAAAGDATPAAMPVLPVPPVPPVLSPTTAITGRAAFAVLQAQLEMLRAAMSKTPAAKAAVAKAPTAAKAPVAKAPVSKAPELTLASCDFGGAPCADGESYDPYMDYFPRSYVCGATRTLDVSGRMLAVSQPEDKGPLVATVHHVALCYLLEWHLAAARGDESAAAAARAQYAELLAMVREASALLGGADAADLFMASAFAPAVRPMGDVNHDAAYVLKTAAAAARLREEPPAGLHMPPVAGLLQGLPVNYYPAPGRVAPVYAYESPLFRRSGAAETVAPPAAETVAPPAKP